MTSRRSGYTLLEVTLVLALLVLLASLAYPSFESMYADVRVEAAADQVRAVWADARTQASEEDRPYVFSVQPGTGVFRMAPDDSDAALTGQPTGGGLTRMGALPSGVRFSMQTSGANGASGGDFVPVATFMPNGSAQQDVSITFETPSARPLTLNLRALTGTVSVQRPGGGR